MGAGDPGHQGEMAAVERRGIVGSAGQVVAGGPQLRQQEQAGAGAGGLGGQPVGLGLVQVGPAGRNGHLGQGDHQLHRLPPRRYYTLKGASCQSAHRQTLGCLAPI